MLVVLVDAKHRFAMTNSHDDAWPLSSRGSSEPTTYFQCLADLFVAHGPPEHIRSDNGPEFAALAVRDWLGRIGVKTRYIERPSEAWLRQDAVLGRTAIGEPEFEAPR